MKNKFAFIAVIFLVAGGIWYGLSQGSVSTPTLTSATPTASGSPTEESDNQQLVATLLTLRTVNLTSTIFTDPTFTSLRDFGTTIVDEPHGRANPFAPLVTPGQSASAAAAGAIGTPIQQSAGSVRR